MTTPLRIVYDCSSCEAKHLASLNDCGPLFLQHLPAILLRFCAHKFGFSADIEKAFYMYSYIIKIVISLVFSGHPTLVILRVHCKRTAELSFLVQPVLRLCYMLHSTVTEHDVVPVSKDLLQNLYVDNVLSG